jgi:protein O-mannosyl-transferase
MPGADRHVVRSLPFWIPGLLALTLYLPSLTFDRTLDDLAQIPVPGEANVGSWHAVWTQPYWKGAYAGGGLYRPIASATYWIEAELGSPLWARHLANVLLHVAVTLIVVRLAFIIGLSPPGALAAGLLFAAHPSHVEVVAGLVGRAELLASLWMGLALLLHHRLLGSRQPRPAWVLVFAVLAFLAAGSKESAWTLALFALPLHAVRRILLRRGGVAFLGYGLGLAAHLLVRLRALGGLISAAAIPISADENSLVGLHGWHRLAGGLRVSGVYLGHLVFPIHLSPDYSGRTVAVSGSIFDPSFLGGCLFAAGLLALLVVGWRRRPTPGGAAALVAGVWIGTAFLLTMNVLFDLATTVADRLLFWPSAGWSLLVGAALFDVQARAEVPAARVRRALASVLTLLLLGGYAAVTSTYLPAWKDNLVLFERACRAAPTSARVWSAYGRALQDAGRFEEARDAFHRSQALSPRFLPGWSQEAALLIAIGRPEDAKVPLEQALRLAPGDVGCRVNEAIIWYAEGKTKEAETRLRGILDQFPRVAPARRCLALCLEQDGTAAEAAAEWRRYLELAPHDAEALNSLARILVTEPGGAGEAERLARRAIAIDPRTPGYLDTLGAALFHQGRFEEAADAWRAYLKDVPDEPGVLNDLAWILATELDRADEAEPLARRAVGIEPDDPDYLDTLAECLLRQGRGDEAAQVARKALGLEGAKPELRRFLEPGGR